jgi:hypothetical protein
VVVAAAVITVVATMGLAITAAEVITSIAGVVGDL